MMEIVAFVSVAANAYLIMKVFRTKARSRKAFRAIETLAKQGKIDRSDVSDAVEASKAEYELKRDVKAPLYGRKR